MNKENCALKLVDEIILSESCPRKYLLRQYGFVTGFVKDYRYEFDPVTYFRNEIIQTAT